MLLKQEEVNKIKEQYPIGTRIRLIYMDDSKSVEPNTMGTVRGVDDQGQLLMQWDNGRGLALLPDVDQFEVVPSKTLRVVIVEPDQHPRVEMIEDTLEEMQRIVNGCIEAVDLDDGGVLICNDVGKILDLKANRKVGSDIIAGTFFIVGDDGSEDFVSLTEEQAEEFTKRFYEIEHHTQEQMQEDPMMSIFGWK